MTSEKEILIWAKALYSSLEGKNLASQRAVFKKLEQVLNGRRKGYFLPKILARLEKISLKRKRIELSLARKHSPETIRKIKNKLLKTFGKGKNIVVEIEEGLIGGFKAKTANILIKGSIRDYLDELKSRC